MPKPKTLYLTSHHVLLRRDGALIELVRRNQTKDREASSSLEHIRHFQPEQLQALALFGGAHTTTPAMRLLLRSGVPVTWLTRSGRHLGTASPSRGRATEAWTKQLACYADASMRLQLARQVVRAKITAQQQALRRWKQPAEKQRRLQALCESVRKVTSLESLLGIEGSATRVYFKALAQQVKPPFAFTGRRARPAKDPVNALLSLCYTLLAKRIEGLLLTHGLDARMGFLHRPFRSRPAFALDAMESFRHRCVDRFVLNYLNRKRIRAEDFKTTDRGGLRLLDEPFRKLLSAWDSWLEQPHQDGDGVERSEWQAMRGMVGGLMSDLLADTIPGEKRFRGLDGSAEEGIVLS